MTRPILNKHISVNDFNNYYWLKKELIEFCRKTGIAYTGGKIDISNRILLYLKTGEIITKPVQKRINNKSSFNWNNEKLDNNTIITNSYKNTDNVRGFFTRSIGNTFKFNVEFMNWMKINNGKTLKDAIEEWKNIAERRKDKSHKTDIAPQFEYNTYIRDFLTDNPNLSTKDAIKSWKIKRSIPGNNKYSREDL